MGGITREVQSLVGASNAYERDQATNPFDPAVDTAYAYWEALKVKHGRSGVRAHVVVDIIAGTSAGGINGVILAKALACEASQTALRDVWLEQGDISVLLANPVAKRLKWLPAQAVAAGLATAANGNKPPLNGKLMLTQIHKALEAMTPGSAPGTGGKWAIELHVTMTDFFGYPLSAPSWDPKAFRELRHRHHLSFRSDRDELGPGANYALAFAARATSSFPGAFPPVKIVDLKNQLGATQDQVQDFINRFWRTYAVAEQLPQDTVFVDGGVLDNAPFDLAVAALRDRPANVEVDRRLLFIQPDPRDPQAPVAGAAPSVAHTVLGGLSGIPRQEPVLDQLLAVHQHNIRVDRAEAIIEEIAASETEDAPTDLGEATDKAYDDVGSLGPA